MHEGHIGGEALRLQVQVVLGHLRGRELPLVHYGAAGQRADVDVVVVNAAGAQLVLDQLAQHVHLCASGRQAGGKRAVGYVMRGRVPGCIREHTCTQWQASSMPLPTPPPRRHRNPRPPVTCVSMPSTSDSSVVDRVTKNCSTSGSVLIALSPRVLQGWGGGGGRRAGLVDPRAAALDNFPSPFCNLPAPSPWHTHRPALHGAAVSATTTQHLTCCWWARGASPAARGPGWRRP